MRWKGTRLNKHHNGERVHTAKLCADDVRLIKTLLRDEQMSLNTIATKFGVSRNAIWDIKHGYTWKHITKFDKQWYGHVPFGHWLITKQWRTTSE